MTRSLRVRVTGLDEVLRALRDLPAGARRELRTSSRELSTRLARFARAAGKADSRQSARAASTVRSIGGGFTPVVTAGPHPLLFGSEFGSNARWGWYSRPRYRGSPLRQFRPHLGGGSYWFFKTLDEHGADIDSAWQQCADAIIRSWSA